MKPYETHALGAVGVGDERGRRQYLNYDLKEKSHVPQGIRKTFICVYSHICIYN